MFGLAIAASTTVFGWFQTVLLRPVPGVTEPGSIHALEAVAPDGRHVKLTHPDFRDFQRELTLSSGVAAASLGFFAVGPPENARHILGQVVSANYFEVLGVAPFVGRLLAAREDKDSPGAFPNVVISYRLWQSTFASNQAIAGQPLRVNGRTYTVVGVAPKEFHGSIGGIDLDLWVPLSQAVEVGNLNTWAATDRNARFLDVTVRLKAGVPLAQLRAEASSVARRIAAAHPDTHREFDATVVPLDRADIGLQSYLAEPLRLLMAICAVVLLIAAANVANLLMARTMARSRELAVRSALGASRANLARQILSEVFVLASAGALVGVLVTSWLSESILYFLPAFSATVRGALAPILSASAGGSGWLFSILIAAAAASIAAAAPIAYVAASGPAEALRSGGRTGSAGATARRARDLLLIAEVSMATFALAGAGLVLWNFWRLSQTQIGFRPEGVLTAQLHLASNGYSLEREKQFGRALRQRLEALPEIESVTFSNAVPLSLFTFSDRVQDFGPASGIEGAQRVPCSIIAPGYFHALDIPLLRGRDFDERDDLTRPLVIIVNETFARHYLKTSDPVGRKLRVSGNPVTVIGLVRDSKYLRHGESATPFFYGAFGQMFWSGHNHFLLARARDAAKARESIRREAAALDPAPSLVELSTLREYSEAGLFGERVASGLLSVLAVLALLLALAGLYSVMAYHVAERTREIGIRMALGATQEAVLAGVLRRSLTLTGAGILIGCVLADFASRLAGSTYLALDTGSEPLIFMACAALLLVAATLTVTVPARRAAAVPPVLALSAE